MLAKVYKEKTSWHVAAKADSTELLQITMEPAKEKLTTKGLSYKILFKKRMWGKKILAKWQQRRTTQGYEIKYRSLLKNLHQGCKIINFFRHKFSSINRLPSSHPVLLE